MFSHPTEISHNDNQCAAFHKLVIIKKSWLSVYRENYEDFPKKFPLKKKHETYLK